MHKDFATYMIVCQRNTKDARGSQELFQNSLKATSIPDGNVYRIIKRIVECENVLSYPKALGHIAQMYTAFEKNKENLAPLERDAINILAMKEDLPPELYVPAIELLIHSNQLKQKVASSENAAGTPESKAEIKELKEALQLVELTLTMRISKTENLRNELELADNRPLRAKIIAYRSAELELLLDMQPKISEKSKSTSVIGRKLQMFSDNINSQKLDRSIDNFATLLNELKNPKLNDQQFKDKNKELIDLRREIANLVDPAKREVVLAGASDSKLRTSENRSMKANR
jgi:hypothetical protein